MIEFSPNVETLEPSATMAVANRAKELIAQGRDVLDLCVGEPDFPTPAYISKAGIEAIRAGHTRYTPPAGIPQLRAAIARELAATAAEDHDVDAHGVVVSCGAKQALFNACFALFGPGDRVLIPAPYWTSYPAIVELSRAEPVIVPSDASSGFKVGPEDLDRAAAGGAKGLMINSPSNPSGAVYTREELRAIGKWARSRDIWIISDEIYRRIYFEGTMAPGMLDLPAELLERTVIIDGASKAFAMTGWRIGFSYTSRELATKIASFQSQTTSSTATPSQYAALAAYEGGDEGNRELESMRQSFQSRKEMLVSLLRQRLPDLRFHEPEGAFYLWISTAGLAQDGEGSIALCERLLQDAGIALIPGAAFGDDGHVRLSFAYTEDTLQQAVERLASRQMRRAS